MVTDPPGGASDSEDEGVPLAEPGSARSSGAVYRGLDVALPAVPAVPAVLWPAGDLSDKAVDDDKMVTSASAIPERAFPASCSSPSQTVSVPDLDAFYAASFG